MLIGAAIDPTISGASGYVQPIPVRGPDPDRRAVCEAQLPIAIRTCHDLTDLVSSHNHGPMHAHPARGIEFPFECAQRLAYPMSGARHVQYDVVVVGVDPGDGTDRHQ